MVTTRVSGLGCWTSMFPPPLCVHRVRDGVTWAVRLPRLIDTSGAGAAVTTVIWTGWPGWTTSFFTWPRADPATKAGTDKRPAPNRARRVIRDIANTSE